MIILEALFLVVERILGYWRTAIGPEVLSNPHICDILISFDRNKITIKPSLHVV